LLGDAAAGEGLGEDAEAGWECGEAAIEEPEASAPDEEPGGSVSSERSAGEVVNEQPEDGSTPVFCFDPERITDAGAGRRRWLQEARGQL
jgi:hypothetical protein